MYIKINNAKISDRTVTPVASVSSSYELDRILISMKWYSFVMEEKCGVNFTASV